MTRVFDAKEAHQESEQNSIARVVGLPNPTLGTYTSSEILALRTQKFTEALVTSDDLAGRKDSFVSCSSFCGISEVTWSPPGTGNQSLT